MFSAAGRSNLDFEPWYEREKRTWLEFRKGCKGRTGIVCYIMGAQIVCNEESKDKCPLWFVKNFKEREIRNDTEQRNGHAVNMKFNARKEVENNE